MGLFAQTFCFFVRKDVPLHSPGTVLQHGPNISATNLAVEQV